MHAFLHPLISSWGGGVGWRRDGFELKKKQTRVRDRAPSDIFWMSREGGEKGLNSVAGYVAVFGDKSLRISLRGSDLTKKS
jgi:hypothetical protein